MATLVAWESQTAQVNRTRKTPPKKSETYSDFFSAPQSQQELQSSHRPTQPKYFSLCADEDAALDEHYFPSIGVTLQPGGSAVWHFGAPQTRQTQLAEQIMFDEPQAQTMFVEPQTQLAEQPIFVELQTQRSSVGVAVHDCFRAWRRFAGEAKRRSVTPELHRHRRGPADELTPEKVGRPAAADFGSAAEWPDVQMKSAMGEGVATAVDG